MKVSNFSCSISTLFYKNTILQCLSFWQDKCESFEFISVEIWYLSHFQVGVGSAWYLQHVNIQAVGTDKQWNFPCGKWLDKSAPVCELAPSGDKALQGMF